MNIYKLSGEKVKLRLVEVKDAQFILSLRQNPSLSKYISSTNITIEQQENWIKNYKVREKEEKEYYFIVGNLDSIPVGTVRIYDISFDEKKCVWGSFILSSKRPNGSSYEVMDLTIKFIEEELNLKQIKLDVRKDNVKAIHIYEKFGFVRISEDELNYFYEYVF